MADHKCKKYRSIKACNSAPEGCGWIPHKKCLPLESNVDTSTTKVNIVTNNTNAHINKCKSYKTIKACNETRDDCHWVPRLKCLPGKKPESKYGAKKAIPNKDKSPIKNKSPKKAVQQQEIEQEENEWLTWYCREVPRTKRIATLYCKGKKPLATREAKAAAIETLSNRCIDMADPITADEFNESKSIEYLHSVVPVGSRDKRDKSHCYDSAFMLELVFSQMLHESIGGSILPGTVKDPMTNNPMSMEDINRIIDANLDIMKVVPKKTRPAFLRGINRIVTREHEKAIDLHKISVIELTCTGIPFKSLAPNLEKRVSVKTYNFIDFDEKDSGIPGFSRQSVVDAMTILVNNGRVQGPVFSSLETLSTVNTLYYSPFLRFNKSQAPFVHKVIKDEFKKMNVAGVPATFR